MTTVVYRAGRVEPVERKKQPVWNDKPDPDDYSHARDFLALMMPDAFADKAVALLRAAPIVQLRANDILRASPAGYPTDSDPDVDKHVDQIKDGQPFAPVLLIQGTADTAPNLAIADGWHRVAATYLQDPTAMVPAKIAKGVFDADGA